VTLFGRTFRYEERAIRAIQQAKGKWGSIDDVLAALEWGIMHDPMLGTLLNERGIRGFVCPGARSINEPDIDVLYEEIRNLMFREAKSHYAGQA
jgi:hypothetical protein